jgi:dipeptidyl aminopeptidase/acylaminoacyl peptidase
VTARGLVDPARVGLIGHSWGGYQAAFIPTRTGDLFAATVAGAPLTDFVSFMGQIHWQGGGPELTHWETGQARMEVPYWEDVASHLRNSPLHEVQNLTTPMLMAFGDEDGTVEWWQGTVFYNYARRAGKQMVLLVYEGEGHGFNEKPNQVDYHRRINEWFGHYLKGEPAPRWITDGIPFEQLNEEKKRVASSPAKPSAAEANNGGRP